MSKLAVVLISGKQYLVKDGDVITVDKITDEANVDVKTLAVLDDESHAFDLTDTKAASAEILEQLKGDKIRVAKFKAKVRIRKVNGFRAHLTKVKVSIA